MQLGDKSDCCGPQKGNKAKLRVCCGLESPRAPSVDKSERGCCSATKEGIGSNCSVEAADSQVRFDVSVGTESSCSGNCSDHHALPRSCGLGRGCQDNKLPKSNCCPSPGRQSDVAVTSVQSVDEKNPVDLNVDLEQIPPNLEHVLLDVQGLTCTGCETKLYRSLQKIPGLYHIQTSLVLSQAEFDLDTMGGSVDDVIKNVQKATGFACQLLNSEGQELDVIVDDGAKSFAYRPYPKGVLQMTAVGKQIVRILYDGRMIGARALLDASFDRPLKLAPPRKSAELESGKKHVRNMAWTTLLSITLTIPVLVMAWADLPPRPVAYGSASLALATVIQFVVAGPFYPSALRALLFTHVIEIDLLIVLSTSTAYIFSLVSFAYLVAGRPLQTEQFFETSTLLITLIVLGRLVSAFARQRAVESVSIRSLQEETTTLCTLDGLNDKQIDVRLLQYGDCFKVLPDSRVATDGIIVSGTTEIDESMVTGESRPVEKMPGSRVIAGSLNGSGLVVVRLTHLPGDNTVSSIAAMVDQAKFSKPKTQEIVDIVAGYFVPVILALTMITFAIWVAIGVTVRHQHGGPAVVNAITYSLSVLIVSCPCAIGLAVPMVIVIAGGVASKHGVIFKSAMTIEIARNISHVVFDKTGTLTHGQLSVMDEMYLTEDAQLSAAIALAITRDNKHPVSVAISTYLQKKGIQPAAIGDVKSITGKGVQGSLGGLQVRGGNTRWLCADAHPQVQILLAQGLTVFGITVNGELVAAYGLSDSLRPESEFVVTELQKRNITVSIISGDDAGPVDAVAAKLNIPPIRVKSKCTPGDKRDYLSNLKAEQGSKILFCGDGTNDAVALAQADIGVHINTGSDVAQTAADVVLVRPYLSGILVLLDLSKAAFHRIAFNFAWAFVYNLFATLLAGGAFVDVRIEPQYAGLGEIVSVLPVILVALQLKFFKRRYQ